MEQAEEALALVQKLDPPGVGARNLEECLLLQLTPETPHRDVLRVLIQNHLDDIRHNRLPAIQRKTGFDLAAVQARILSEAAHVVRRGGRLVYSTCSVEREENEEVVNAFLTANPDFKQMEAAPAPAALLQPTGAARTWPHRDDVDGFFVAAMERQ